MSTYNNNDNNINDGCTPSATNESRFIDVFSEEKLSLSEEQARDDDMPSTSVLVVGTPCEFPAASTLNVKNDSEGNTTIPPTSTTIPCSKSVESHRPITGRVSKRKKKGKRGGRKGGGKRERGGRRKKGGGRREGRGGEKRGEGA